MRMPTIKSLKSESSLGWDEVRFQVKLLGSVTSAWRRAWAEMVQVLGPRN